MVRQGKYQYIYEIGSPTHSARRRFPVVKSWYILGRKYPYHKWSQVGYQHSGGCMKTRGHGKEIKYQSCEKSYKHEPNTGY